MQKTGGRWGSGVLGVDGMQHVRWCRMFVVQRRGGRSFAECGHYYRIPGRRMGRSLEVCRVMPHTHFIFFLTTDCAITHANERHRHRVINTKPPYFTELCATVRLLVVGAQASWCEGGRFLLII